MAFVPDAHIPWYATVYLNPGAFHAQSIPYQPAAVYEIGLNLVKQVDVFDPFYSAGIYVGESA